MKSRVAFVVSLLVPMMASSTEVNLEEDAQVALPADHTAHNAIRGMIDNLSSDLIGLVGSFLFESIYEKTKSTTRDQVIMTGLGWKIERDKLITDLQWIADDVVEAKAKAGGGLRYTGEGAVVPRSSQQLPSQMEDKVVIIEQEPLDERKSLCVKTFSSNVTTNLRIEEFKITRNGKTYNFGAAADLAVVSWHPDGSRYAVASRHGLFIWDEETGRLKHHLDQDDYTKYRCQVDRSNMNWNPSDHTLAVTNGALVKLYDTEKGEGFQLCISYLPVPKNHGRDVTIEEDFLVDDNRMHNSITCLTWNPKGDKLAIGCSSYYQTRRRRLLLHHFFTRLQVFANYSRILPALLTPENREELQRRRQRWEKCLIQ